MNKSRHPTKILYMIIIIAIWCIPVLSQPMDEIQETITLPVGRDNPFAQISRPVRPIPQTISASPELVEEQPELFMQTIMLKFLDAKSLMTALENMLSRYGTMATDEDNKSLIVCDTRENLDKIISEIQKADKTPEQIMVEVVIIDVQLSDDTELGINWDILSDNTYDIGYRQNFTNRLGSTIDSAANIGNATAFNTTGTGGDFSVISGTIRNVVSMLLQQKKNIEILASPRVMVVSGKTASIEAVRELPYNEITNTSQGGQLSSTEFKKVGVKLNVTATLTEDKLIFLSVDSEQNVTVGESISQVPIIDTRNTKSELVLKDGQVVIIGGLRRQEKTQQINQIPILGDIPLIGFLFRYNNTILNNTELIVFLSPHIYKDEPIPDDAMNKFNEIIEKPMLLLPEDAKLRGYHDQLKQQYKEKTATIEQLQQEIIKSEQLESELKKYYEHIESRAKEQSNTNERILQDITVRKQEEEELKIYRNQLDQLIKEKNATNEQLQAQINENIKVESELKEYHEKLQQNLIMQTDAVEQLQQKIIERMQDQREATKTMLMERIKILQSRNDKEAAQELLLTLNSLDKILSHEINEALNTSDEILSNENAINQ